MNPHIAPPRIVVAILERFLPADIREAILGDLDESFNATLREHGATRARRYYWRESLQLLPLMRLPAPGSRTGDSMFETLRSDIRFGWRQLLGRPLHTVLLVFTLGLGIGAASAIFSAVRPILFAPLPYPHGDRLVLFSERSDKGTSSGIGFATIKDVADRNHSFDAVAAMATWQPVLTGRSQPEMLEGERVSWTFFDLLDTRPMIGRTFRREEDAQAGERVVILSHTLWRSRFGGDSTIVGKTAVLSGTPFTVIGVMPASFENVLGPQATLWTPLRYDVSLPWACRTCHHLRAIARLHPTTTIAQASADLNHISQQLVSEYPKEYHGPGMLVTAVSDWMNASIRPALFAVIGAVALLLLIACVNVVNLMLARTAQRRGELAVRTALGAERRRLLGQLLTESMLVSLLGGALGVAIAVAGVQALIAVAPERLPRVDAIRVDAATLVFACALTTLVGIGCGILPALHGLRSADLHGSIKTSTRRAAGTQRSTSGVLVIAEVALALMLLVGSGLLLRTLTHLLARSPGFDASGLLTLEIQTSGKKFEQDSSTWRFFAQVLDQVRSVPGVQSAALTSQLPLSGDYDSWGIHLESRPSANPSDDPSAFRYGVSPGYLETMGIRILQGRSLQPADASGSIPVVVISRSMARSLWPDRSPIGERIRTRTSEPWRTIVGVADDVRQESLAAPQPFGFYVPETQEPNADNAMTLVVRSNATDRAPLISALRKAIWSVDHDQPIVRIATMTELLSATESQRLFTLMLFGAFASVALVLAAAGIYGVLSTSVSERIAELGVRSALGASRGNLLWLVVRQGAVMTGTGLGLGLIGASVLSRFIASLIATIDRIDVLTYATVSLLLAGVAAIASGIPAWRAARVDPAVVLRAE